MWILTGIIGDNDAPEIWNLMAGVPAKRVRAVGPDLSQNEIERIAACYLKYAGWFKEEP